MDNFARGQAVILDVGFVRDLILERYVVAVICMNGRSSRRVATLNL